MRSFGLSLALVASAQLVMLTSPALAQGPTDTSGGAAPSPSGAPAAPSTPPPAATDAAPAAPADATPPPPASSDGTVEVHIESSVKVSLERRAAQTAPWEFACESPCDQRLPVGDQYRAVGANINESKPFNLDASKGDRITLNVYPGEKNKEKIGLYVLIGGAVFFVAGAIVVAAGSPNRFDSDGTLSSSRLNALAGGVTLMVLGATGALFGGAWMWGNAHSSVGGDKQAAPPATGSLPVVNTGMRTPSPAPMAFSVPIWSGTF